MSIDWFFWSATLFFFIFEWGVSHAYSDTPFFPKKGLITDIASAASIWALSFLVYLTASAVKLDCKSASQLPGFDMQGCLNNSGDIFTVGDVLNSTFGLNPIWAATIMYIVLGVGVWGYKRVNGQT